MIFDKIWNFCIMGQLLYLINNFDYRLAVIIERAIFSYDTGITVFV